METINNNKMKILNIFTKLNIGIYIKI